MCTHRFLNFSGLLNLPPYYFNLILINFLTTLLPQPLSLPRLAIMTPLPASPPLRTASLSFSLSLSPCPLSFSITLSLPLYISLRLFVQLIGTYLCSTPTSRTVKFYLASRYQANQFCSASHGRTHLKIHVF